MIVASFSIAVSLLQVVSADFLISFHGGAGSGDVNNIHRFQDDIDNSNDVKILPDPPPVRDELRGFALHNGDLYVANANQQLNQILRYRSTGPGPQDWEPVGDGIFASRDTANGIYHPYQIVFDSEGYAYVSSQNTNMVTRLDPSGNPTEVAPHLAQSFPGETFLDGTWVASSEGALPGLSIPTPPNVPTPQGLSVGWKDGDVQNSIRGLAVYEPYLLVSDEPANAVQVYDLATGEWQAQIIGGALVSPVQLLIHQDMLYIGSSDTDSVLTVDLSSVELEGVIIPQVFVDGKAKKVSGMAIDDQGTFYVAERVTRKIFSFDANGQNKTRIGDELHDDPEYILWVPSLPPSTAPAEEAGTSAAPAEETVTGNTSGCIKPTLKVQLLLSTIAAVAFYVN